MTRSFANGSVSKTPMRLNSLLPLSLQLVGRPFTEAMLYRVAQFYERTTGWTTHHPAGLAD